MNQFNDGSKPGLFAYCPSCRSTAQHKLISVSDGISILWCEHCRVPRINDAPDEATREAGIVEALGATAAPRLVFSHGVRVDRPRGGAADWRPRP